LSDEEIVKRIQEIKLNKANVEYCADHQIINGSLMVDLIRFARWMQEHLSHATAGVTEGVVAGVSEDDTETDKILEMALEVVFYKHGDDCEQGDDFNNDLAKVYDFISGAIGGVIGGVIPPRPELVDIADINDELLEKIKYFETDENFDNGYVLFSDIQKVLQALSQAKEGGDDENINR